MKKSSIKEVVCENCKIIFKKRIHIDKTKNSKNNYCTRNCKKEHCKVEWTEEMKDNLSKKMTGSNNPNYGNSWTEEMKDNLSKFKIEQYKNDDVLRFSVGKSNRGIKFDEERINKMHMHRSKESYYNYNKKLSDETKRKIGLKSKNKFNYEYNKKFRETMVTKGYWFDNDTYEWNYYNRISNWQDSMFKYVELPKDFNEIGIFNIYNNTKGYVRDHIVSRRDSYVNLLHPEIVRHPANCNIIRHFENTSKRSNSSIDITSLFDKIRTYDNIKYRWAEHVKCLEMIDLYIRGNKWEKTL